MMSSAGLSEQAASETLLATAMVMTANLGDMVCSRSAITVERKVTEGNRWGAQKQSGKFYCNWRQLRLCAESAAEKSGECADLQH